MPFLIAKFPPTGGGGLVVPAGGSVQLLGEVPVSAAQPTQEEVWTLSRFHAELPVALKEIELEKKTTFAKTYTIYKTEAEAASAQQNTGGRIFRNEDTQPIGYGNNYEFNFEFTTLELKVLELIATKEHEVRRSVLPININLILELVGSDGVIWSSSFDMPIRYAGLGINPGEYLGTGYANIYADLVNPVTLLSGQPLQLRLLAQVPSSVRTVLAVGAGVEGAKETNPPATVALFYDPSTRTDYPITRGGAHR